MLEKASSEIVEILTRAGGRVSGVVKNEDNFSVQLLGVDGGLHLLMKSDIQLLRRDASQLRHGDYGKRLTSDELKDLVSYMTQVGG